MSHDRHITNARLRLGLFLVLCLFLGSVGARLSFDRPDVRDWHAGVHAFNPVRGVSSALEGVGKRLEPALDDQQAPTVLVPLSPAAHQPDRWSMRTAAVSRSTDAALRSALPVRAPPA